MKSRTITNLFALKHLQFCVCNHYIYIYIRRAIITSYCAVLSFIHEARDCHSPAWRYIENILNSDRSFMIRDKSDISARITSSLSIKCQTYLMQNPDLSVHKIYKNCTERSTIEYQRIAYTRFRLGSHRLKVETGRWSRIPRENRKCDCGIDDIQDEAQCLHFENTRRNYMDIIPYIL